MAISMMSCWNILRTTTTNRIRQGVRAWIEVESIRVEPRGSANKQISLGSSVSSMSGYTILDSAFDRFEGFCSGFDRLIDILIGVRNRQEPGFIFGRC